MQDGIEYGDFRALAQCQRREARRRQWRLCGRRAILTVVGLECCAAVWLLARLVIRMASV